MKQIKYITILLAISVSFFACYEDYEKDFDYTTVYFGTQQPLRTVIADRGMSIKVGVNFGGTRAVDENCWAQFEIDPSLLTGTTMTLLPAEYYRLADPNTFRISNKNLSIADVAVSFTDAFYADPNSMKNYYALPFRITSSSADSIHGGSFDEDGTSVIKAKNYSIVAIKYISTYHGTYYVKGTMTDLGTGTKTVYSNSDLSQNITRDIFTISTKTVQRPGLANNAVVATEAVKMTIVPNGSPDKIYPVTVETPAGCLALSDTEGTYYGNKERPEISLKYKFTKGGKNYSVEETLILRQDPEKDLRYEVWN